MNYLKEINALYRRIEANPLSGSAILLWHGLMQINNSTGWSMEFTAAVTTLRTKSTLSDSSFKRARKELQEKGYIHVRSRTGNQSAVYRMVSLAAAGDNDAASRRKKYNTNPNHEPAERSEQPEQKYHMPGQAINRKRKYPDPDLDHNERPVNASRDNNVNQNANGNLDHKTAPLIKEKGKQKPKKKQIHNDHEPVSDTIVFYQENFGMVTPYVSGDLLNWISDVGDDLVMEALKRALDWNKPNWGYAKGILRSWANKGITTCEQVHADEVAFSNRRQEGRGNGRKQNYTSNEVIPDWFHELEVMREAEVQKGNEKSDEAVMEEVQGVLDAFLGKEGQVPRPSSVGRRV